MERKLIIKNYLKTWFAIDLSASIPYSLFIDYYEKLYVEETSNGQKFKTP
jgi:hypothetical protein